MTPDLDKIADEVAKELDAYFLTAAGGNKNALPTKEVWNKEFARRLVERIQREQAPTITALMRRIDSFQLGESTEATAIIRDTKVLLRSFPPATPSAVPDGWHLSASDVNDIQAGSINRLIELCKHAHLADVRVRINGKDEWFEADWIKLLSAAPAPAGEKGEQ